MSHVVLLGDSVLDNAAYTGKGPCVHDQLRARLPSGSRATLLAVDGDTVGRVRSQLGKLPSDATHLVMSAGGNDALGQMGVLTQRASTVGEALVLLAQVRDEFEKVYRGTVDALIATKRPVAVCTIYYPRFTDATIQRVAVAALASFNDVILRAAFARGLPVLDLRLICTEPGDYANEIEPSSRGGDKIARAIVELVATHPFDGGRSAVYL